MELQFLGATDTVSGSKYLRKRIERELHRSCHMPHYLESLPLG